MVPVLKFEKARIRTILHDVICPRKRTIVDCLIFLVVSVILTLIWFRGGSFIARGELGLCFYNYPRLLEGYSYIWIEPIATGMSYSQTLTTIPFFAFMTLFDSILHSYVFEQATVLFLLLFLTQFSMYCLTKTIIKNQMGRLAGVIAGLFYLLNPYSMTCIWHRAAFGLWFILPIFPMVLCLYLKGLETGKTIRYALLINLVLFLFSIVFMNPAFLLIIIFICFSAVFPYLLQKQTNNLSRRIYYVFKFSCITLILFFILNSWWILPSIITTSPTFVTGMPADYNIQTFIGVSQSYPLQNMLQLMHGNNFLWQPVYSTAIFRLIGFSIPVFAFSALWFKRKNKFVLFFSILALLGIFVTKGTQPPLGTELTLWILKNVSILQVFRNPFEKLGVITSLSYAFLIGFTLSAMYLYLKKLFKSRRFLHSIKASLLVIIMLVSLISGLFVFPMWTGTVMSEEGGNLPWEWANVSWYTDVPSYYKLADNWLSAQPEVFRVVGLPMSQTDTVHYNWSSGFFGMNPWNLFSKPTITTKTDLSFVNDITQSVEYQLSRSDQVWKYLGLLNAKYICLHNDSAYPSAVTQAQSPENVAMLLTSNHLIPDFENQTQITSCEDSATLWRSYGVALATDIMLDNLTFTEGGASIRASILTKAGGWEGGVAFDPTQSLDLTGSSLITFNVKTDSLVNAQSVWFRTWDSQGNWRGWNIIDTIVQGEWSKVYIDLSKGGQTPVAPNMSDINRISFGVISEETVSASVNLWIDDIQSISGKNVTGQEHLSYVTTFGELDFYKVDPEYFMPRIYVADQFTVTSNVATLFETLDFTPIDPRNTVIFLNSQSFVNNMAFLRNLGNSELNKPDILFRQINPTKYEIQIQNATAPFFLVFASTYDDYWTANVNGHSISSSKHFVVNGYANAWYIEKSGSYQIVLEYEPQKLFTYGSIISITGFVTCSLCIVLSILFKKKRLKFRGKN